MANVIDCDVTSFRVQGLIAINSSASLVLDCNLHYSAATASMSVVPAASPHWCGLVMLMNGVGNVRNPCRSMV